MRRVNEFTEKTKQQLCRRVASRCGNPGCARVTTGPHTDSEGAVSIGKAAHITACASGGPRYDASLTSGRRSSAENGIWLCSACHDLVDADPERYPTSLLRDWKRETEETVFGELEQERSTLSRRVSSLAVALTVRQQDSASIDPGSGNLIVYDAKTRTVTEYLGRTTTVLDQLQLPY